MVMLPLGACIMQVPKINELLKAEGRTAANPEWYPTPSCPFYQVRVWGGGGGGQVWERIVWESLARCSGAEC